MTHHLEKSSDLDALIENIGNRRIVMLGEASHGTHEFYTWRTALSKRLMAEKNFNFIAVEGDWPDCFSINCYVKNTAMPEQKAADVLHKFNRWPTWMWANWETAALADWMRDFNSKQSGKPCGFYGLDVYSLWDSMAAMMHYLEKKDPQTARSVKKAIACFEPYQENEHLYARSALTESGCRDEVLELLRQIRTQSRYGLEQTTEADFNNEQNALIAVNAEKYYRSMISFDNESWNIRDRHMMETLERLLAFHGPDSKAIVWAHNTHIGDARATSMEGAGMINLGQLAREAFGPEEVYLVGFAGLSGTVIAAEEWGERMQVMNVPEAREDSLETKMFRQDPNDHYHIFLEETASYPFTKLGHRAIGVVYHPNRDTYANYVPTVAAKRYDAMICIRRMRALHPLHTHPDPGKLELTYPFNM